MAEESGYEVKNVKTFAGMEGQGFNASLYRDGKKVALVIDSAQGGCCDYQWVDWKEPKVDIHITTREGKPHTFKGTPEEKILYEMVDKLPLQKDEDFPDGLKVDNDTFIAGLIDTYDANRWLKNKLKKNYLFQVGKEIGTESYRIIPKKPNLTREIASQFISKKYPNQKFKLITEV